MKNRIAGHWASRAAVWCLAGCLTGLSLSAQAAGVNFEGTWQISTPQSSFKPEGGAIPFTAKGKQAYEENKKYYAKKQYGEYDITQSRCSSPGASRLMLTPMRFKIYQRLGLLQMSFEWNRVNRMIELPDFWKPKGGAGGPQITDDTFGTAEGESKSRWEGDTLVVTTNGFNDKALIDNLVPHGYDLQLTEHIRLKDPNTLEDRITFEDPEFFTKPWHTVVTYTRQPDAPFPEDVCIDRRNAGQLPLPR